MQTKIKTYALCGLGVCMAASALCGATKLHLGGRKDKVIKPDMRDGVLAAADRFLSKHDDGEFDTLLADLQNPYTFEKKREEVEEAPEETVAKLEPVKPKVKIVYDQGAVLKLIAKSFAKQIRGTMGMGDTYFIQYGKKRSLMKAGTQFPVRVPEAREEPFIVTLAEVTNESFSLQIEDTVQSFPYLDTKLSQGAIRLNEEE